MTPLRPPWGPYRQGHSQRSGRSCWRKKRIGATVARRKHSLAPIHTTDITKACVLKCGVESRCPMRGSRADPENLTLARRRDVHASPSPARTDCGRGGGQVAMATDLRRGPPSRWDLRAWPGLLTDIIPALSVLPLSTSSLRIAIPPPSSFGAFPREMHLGLGLEV